MRIGLLASVGHHLDSFFPEIIGYWQREGHVVFPAAGTPTEVVDSETLSALTRRPSRRSLRAVRELRTWTDAQRIDIVVTNTATASFLARLAIRDTPVVYFAHGLHWASERSISSIPWQVLEWLASKRTAGVIVINDEDQNWYQRHAPGVPRLRLPFGVGLDIAAHPRTPTPTGAKPVIVWIGEHSKRKNPFDALRVAAELRALGVTYELRMLGTGRLTDELAQQIDTMDLGDCVTMVGHVPVAEELRRASALLHTAHWEGLPRVFLEALSVGRPVVSYDIKGARNLEGVHTVAAGDHSAMARRASALVDSPITARFPDQRDLSYKHTAKSMLRFLDTILAD